MLTVQTAELLSLLIETRLPISKGDLERKQAPASELEATKLPKTVAALLGQIKVVALVWVRQDSDHNRHLQNTEICHHLH